MPSGIEPSILNTIVQGDCVKSLSKLPAECVDLVFADPPFNIGYEYDVYHDKKGRDEYLGWTRKWIEQVYRVLRPSGTFWLAIGDEYAAEMKVLSQDIGFTSRSWVIWYYTFGVNCTHKFTRSHAHMFYFVKNAKDFTFREGELENRVPSARQLVYNDSRANPNGRLPDDTWILRPQDLVDCFTPGEDTWYFPRVAGTFVERAGFHGCQMPEQLLGRIVRMCSNPGDLVVDPFSGSATTLAVAKKLGRTFLGFELSPDYVKRGTARTEGVRLGDPLDGAAEPLMSAPATFESSRNRSKKKNGNATKANENGLFRESARAKDHPVQAKDQLIRAYESIYDGYTLDRVLADPSLSEALRGKCQELALAGSPKDWNQLLLKFRKAGELHFPARKRTEFSWKDYDNFLFASEIAWNKMRTHGTLDDIFCDPDLANQFDEIARGYAPGFTSLQYRWGAITLRKKSKTFQIRSKQFTSLSLASFKSKQSLGAWENEERLSNLPGLYLISGPSQEGFAYIGSTLNLQSRLFRKFGEGRLKNWENANDATEIWFLRTPEVTDPIDLLSMQMRLIHQAKPRLNGLGPTAT
jgi:DNA modification methylase